MIKDRTIKRVPLRVENGNVVLVKGKPMSVANQMRARFPHGSVIRSVGEGGQAYFTDSRDCYCRKDPQERTRYMFPCHINSGHISSTHEPASARGGPSGQRPALDRTAPGSPLPPPGPRPR